MPKHRFDADEDMDKHLGSDEVIGNVRYIGDEKIVKIEKEEEGYTREELDEYDRAALYEIAKDEGVEVDWSGDDADTAVEMKQKILES